jgi:tetratricopeptide (TPR) repeat protein
MASKRLAQLFILFLLTTQVVRAQNATKNADPETERIMAQISQAKKAEDAYAKSGNPLDANHPNLKSAKSLWAYRLKHPGTYATTLATAEALRLLIRINRISEMQEKVNTLKLSDPAWKQVLNVLLFAGVRTKDYDYVIDKAGTVADGAPDAEIKAKARSILGDCFWRKGDTANAKIAFQKVITDFPKTTYAEDAEGNLGEIEFLNIGQTAPFFEQSTIDGSPFSLASLKGQVVVLKFWGTY